MSSDVAAARVDTAANGLDERSLYLRRLVVRGLAGGSRGHVGSSLSLIEIMRVLYDDILVYRPSEPQWTRSWQGLPRRLWRGLWLWRGLKQPLLPEPPPAATSGGRCALSSGSVSVLPSSFSWAREAYTTHT